MADFTWIDYLIFLVFFVNTMLGLARGLYKETISIMCLIVAFIIAIKFTSPIALVLNGSQGFQDVLTVFTKFTSYNAATSLTLVSYGVSLLVLFVGTFSISEAALFYAGIELFIFPYAIIGRALGGVLGFIRGYALSVVLILVLRLTPLILDATWSQSHLIPVLMPKVTELASLIGGFPSWH